MTQKSLQNSLSGLGFINKIGPIKYLVDLPYTDMNKTLDSLETALKGYSLRAEAIASNVANASTPGYQRRELNFEDQLQKALDKQDQASDIVITDFKHQSLNSKSIEDLRSNLEIGTSNLPVGMDREISDLTKTTMQYKAIAQITKRQLDLLRTSIKGN